MTIAAALMTAEDLLELPADNMRHELVNGELTTMPPTGSEHGICTGRVTLRLGEFVDKHDLGVFFGAETGFIIARQPDTVRAPDFAFIAKNRIPPQGLTAKFFPGAPDLRSFWELLERGEASLSEVPPDRWDIEATWDLSSSCGTN